jgi:hypothetical protein
VSAARTTLSRRALLARLGGGLAATGLAAGLAFRRPLLSRLRRLTRSKEFTATPPLLPHDPVHERRTLAVARGGTPASNVDAVLDKVGLDRFVGKDDVVIVKVSAQWWNQGMTNVAAARRVIERVLALEGFCGEVVVFENTHFRLPNGSGLSRAFTRPSERNVDVDGWSTLGDLAAHYRRGSAPVSFVGLVDGGPSELADDPWHDESHAHGVYGGDGRGPIADGELRDGYRWDFARTFRKKRGWLETARTPLTWPVFTSPRSGLQIDLADGVFQLDPSSPARRTKTGRKLTWLSLVTLNEHRSTGMTACCKSAMGVVDMSAGRLGTDPHVADYQAVHYFGQPDAMWRMAGPLAYLARQVRAPDLYLAVAEWVAVSPAEGASGFGDDDDARLSAAAAHRANTIIAGTDPVAIDWWGAKNVLWPLADAIRARYRAEFDLRDADSKLSRFLRYHREVYGGGTMDDALISVT